MLKEHQNGPNVLALGAVANFGAQNCQPSTKVDAGKNVQLNTSPAIVSNACYASLFSLSSLYFNPQIEKVLFVWLSVFIHILVNGSNF
jgi:hypothetical protein